ncbi:DUF58 domain-containing protein [Haloarcula sp. CBA1130]|uniref:DUF58 domain-containing protein n=1 Tax=unclassified Haloarcula TaxID=2624677 RepID=UPI001248F2B4|nr:MULTISPECIES: DUF58 domain-containing protein [unclassified Haloarcula]KAA9399630.1 DUF58 domain-containing protein [Haloarcula sp. CBA1129]KAA9401354.1 DUF58 domain-containing protein [Haloarcula sp. CBA1130]
MRPTRRGFAVLVFAVAALLISARYGQPGLTAVAGPLFVGVFAAAVQVRWNGAPTVERGRLRRGFPGETKPVEFRVDGSGIATITDRLSEGLEGETAVTKSLPATVTYRVTYAARGEQQVGPIEATVTDALGLVAETYTIDSMTDVLVYPPVYQLGGQEAFTRTFSPESKDRQSFDRLREYVSGDSLRDVHWKSSAKREDLLVKEFTDSRSDRSLLVAAAASEGYADEMAAAAATIATAALESGLAVELAVPNGAVEQGYGDTHRTRLLELLARADAGRTDRVDDADVVITANGDGVTVSVDGRRRSFADVTASRDNPIAGEVNG